MIANYTNQKIHPGFCDLSPEKIEESINRCTSVDTFNSDRKKIIISGLPNVPSGLNQGETKEYYEKYCVDSRFYLPVQFPNCSKLCIRENIFDRTLHLGSTIGLPLHVDQHVRIIGQKHLDLNALDYSGIQVVDFVSSDFPNFDFLKRWNPTTVFLTNMKFKNFGIFGDGLRNLEITNDVDEIDFSEITNLKNLLSLIIETNENFSNYNQCVNKERYINIINLLNMNVRTTVRFNTHMSCDNVYYIIKKYFGQYDKHEYIMDCLIELLDAGYIYAAGK